MFDVVAALGGSDCEGLRSGWLAQPANAVSSFAFVAVGLWVLWRSRRESVRQGWVLAGAAGMVSVGISSVAYHGPQPGWSGLAHDGSIAWLALVVVGRGAWLLARMRGRAFGTVRTTGMPAVAWMAPALAAYVAGRTGSALCHPASLWQPHAAWHGLSAVSLGFAVLACSARGLDQRTSRRPSMPAERWPGTEQ